MKLYINSLKELLIQRLLLILGVFWLISSLAMSWYVREEINEGFDSALFESAHRLLDLASHEINETTGFVSPTTANHYRTETLTNDYLMYQVIDSKGTILLRSEDAATTPMTTSLTTGYSTTQTLRIYTLKHPVDELYIHVADPLKHRYKAQQETFMGLFLPLLMLLPIMAWCINISVKKSLAQLDTLANTLQSKGSHDLTAIPTLGTPLELTPIVENTNSLMLRLAVALDTERALAAHAAHELRTPLAQAQLHLATALNTSVDASTNTAIHAAKNALLQLSRRTEKLLQMSRAQASSIQTQVGVDLVQLCSEVVQFFWADPVIAQRLHLDLPEEHITLHNVIGDMDMLAIALRNLIENALRHAPESHVEVSLSPDHCISVTDNGAALPSDRLTAMRCMRAQQPSNSVGFGLGLSIVKTIVEKHQAILSLESPIKNAQGFQAKISFTQLIR